MNKLAREVLERTIKIQDKRERELLHNRRIYINHIRRLIETNQELAEMLAIERKLRKESYNWYRNRLLSKWLILFDTFVFHIKYRKM